MSLLKASRSGFIAALIIAAAVALATVLVSLAPEPVSIEPPVQTPFAQTATVTAGRGAIPVYGGGTVRPSAEVGVAAQVGGKVIQVAPAFRSGGRVEAGQMLLRVEDADYLQRVQEAEAGIVVYQTAVLEEEEKAALARAEYARYSAQQEDTAAEPAPAALLALREPQLAAARAALQAAQVRLAAARLALSRTEVPAPFDGYVRAESVDTGQIVTSGQIVGQLFAAAAVEVVVPLSDAEAALLPGLWELHAAEQGPEVFVIARYGAGKYAWKGYVDRGEPAVDARTRTIDVVVRVPEPFTAGIPVGAPVVTASAPPLLVGKFVEVEITGFTPQRYFRIPRAALHPDNEVWTVNELGAVGIVPVQVLQRAAAEVFVTGELQDGQTVVTGGIQFAVDGMSVRTGSPD